MVDPEPVIILEEPFRAFSWMWGLRELAGASRRQIVTPAIILELFLI